MRGLFLNTTFILLLISCSSIYCQSIFNKNETANACDTMYNSTNGHFQFHKRGTSIPGDGSVKNCTWTIRINDTIKDSQGIFLFANSFFLQDKYTLSIYAIKDNKSVPYLTYFEGKLEPFGIFVGGYREVNVTLNMPEKSEQHGDFQMYYSTEGCKFNMTTTDTGVFKFPVYEKNVPSFSCNFVFIPGSNTINTLHATFSEFDIPADQYLSVVGSKEDKNYTKIDPPSDLLASDKLELSLYVKNTNISDKITLRYDLTTDSCSDVKTLSDILKSDILKSPPTDNLEFFSSQKFSCLWIVESKPGTIINFDLTEANLTGSSDQILILDGSNQSSPFITLITRANLQSWKTKYIQTSANKAWVAVNSPLAQKDFAVALTITQKYGGFSSQPGPFSISSVDEGVYLYKLEEGKQVEFLFSNATKIPSGGSIKFYNNFERNGVPLVVYDEKSELLPVVSMEHTMTVVVEKFNGGTILGNVSTREPGCFAEEMGSAGSYSLQGACNSLCTWKISPKVNSTDQLQFHFTSIQLSEGDSLAISDAKATPIFTVSGPLSGLPDFIIPASGGALAKITRKDCSTSKTIVQASFASNPGCNSEQKGISGQTVQVSSPNYPNNYPLFASCTYKVAREPTTTSLLHLSFESLVLAEPGHIITLYTLKTEKNKTEKVVLAVFDHAMTQLPGDYLVNDDIYLDFVSPIANKSQPLKSASGFSAKVLTIDNGGVHNSTSGSIMSLGYPGNVSTASIFAWVVEVPPMNSTDAKNIITFHSDNQTKEEELKKFLTIYDGPSIRSNQLSNFSNDIYLSRTNTMIFLYKHLNLSEAGPGMLFDFQAQACNSSLMCENKICMHEDWICNNVNDCGDYSDEKNCQGMLPGPTPKPEPPTPKQSGTSTTALTLGILASLIIGILLGVAAPAAYRRIAGNRFSSYSTFSNTGE